MPLSTYKIADHEFISLDGNPVPPAPTSAIIDRPGIDGSEKHLLGRKGQPFSMVSRVDQSSYSAAKAKLQEYQDLIAEDAVALVQAGVDSEGLGYRVQVLGVTELLCRTITGASGNLLNQPSAAWLECRWDLIAVPFVVT